jgi:ubiquinol-cytochrome c reductase cytochrome b subunit
VRSGHYRPLFRKFFWFGLIPCHGGARLLRRRAGGGTLCDDQPARAAYYFAHFLIILPIVSSIRKAAPLPNSITEAVLGETARNCGCLTGKDSIMVRLSLSRRLFFSGCC